MITRRRLTALALLAVLALAAAVFAGASVATSAGASPASDAGARLQTVQAQLEAVYRQSDVAVEKYNEATRRLATVREQIASNQRLIEVAERELELANEHLRTRARDMYMTEDVGIVDVILAAASFDELVTQLDMMARLSESDAEAVDVADTYRQEVEDRRLALEADKMEAVELVANRRESKNEVLALQARLKSTAQGLESRIAEIQRQEAAAAEARAAVARAAAEPSADAAGTASAATASTADSGSSSDGSSGSATDDSTDPSGDPTAGGGAGAGHPGVVAIAQRYLGVPYVWGGASPKGFDCSGLVSYCYAQLGIYVAHGATPQQQASVRVPLGSLRPGDLVFFGSASYSHHVGIYVGGGSMIHAPHTGAVVSYGSIAGAWTGGRL